MGRKRTATEKAKLTGQMEKHPENFQGRNEPDSPELGAPSDWIVCDLQKKSWEAFKKELPWLRESDRTTVEIASVLRARLMDNSDIGVNAIGQLRLLLNEMGATPATRSKISMPDNKKDALDEFLH